MCVMCFFFFKQKTAYEMRISDWSSDVCSSDLPQRTLPLGIFGGLALVTVLYLLVALALTGMVPYTLLAAAEHPSLATAFIAVGADWAAQQIGRASCRERVCQYV